MKCPGQDPRNWKFDAIFEAECPKCRATLEFFKDEARRKCPKCGYRVLNPKMDFGCAAHCKFAETCFGDLPPELIQQKRDMFKDRVAVAVKKRFGKDFKAISKAVKRARICEKLLEEIPGDPAIVLSASYLMDVANGNKNTDASGSPSEGVQDARTLLEQLDADRALTDEVCRTLDQLQKDMDQGSENNLIVHDALIIQNLLDKKDKLPAKDRELRALLKDELITPEAVDVAIEEIKQTK